jgi:hypothetical protein
MIVPQDVPEVPEKVCMLATPSHMLRKLHWELYQLKKSLTEKPEHIGYTHAASALDLAADLARRSNTLIAVAPKLRWKPAAKIVDLLLNQDCVSPADAAGHAPMTGRAARRLFDRLVLLGAASEFSGRPTFRLYGL